MSAGKIGVGVAAVLAGPPLYAMVQAGTLDGTGALERGAVVAVAAGIGASYIGRLVETYRRQGERERLIAAREARDVVRGQAHPSAGTPPPS